MPFGDFVPPATSCPSFYVSDPLLKTSDKEKIMLPSSVRVEGAALNEFEDALAGGRADAV